MLDSQERELVVLFTDICGYTKYVSTRGTAAGAGLRQRHDDIIKPIIAGLRGVYVKSTGDGIIAYFESPKNAVESAVKIQERFSAYNEGRASDEQIHVKIGIHSGTAIVLEGDILGHAVNFAARLVAVCKPDQILIGRQLHKRLKRIRHVSFRRVGATSLQGIPQPEEVFEVGWQFETLEEKKKGVFVAQAGSRPRAAKILLAALVAASCVAAMVWLVKHWYGVTKHPEPGESASVPSQTSPVPPAKKLYQAAMQSLATGDDSEALEELDQAIKTEPTFLDPYFVAAYTCYQDEQDEKGREYLEAIRRVRVSLTPSMRLKVGALELLFDGKHDDALQKFQALVALSPQDSDAYSYLGDLALEIGRIEDARGALNKCIEMDQDNRFCHFDWMWLEVHEGQFDAVLKRFESLRARRVGYPWFDAPVGYAFLGKGDLGAARARFEDLKNASNKLHGRVHYRAGKDALTDLCLYQGRVAEATGQAELAMQTSTSRGERADYLLTLAEVFSVIGNEGKARGQALKAIKESVDPLTFIRAAKLFAEMGDEGRVRYLLRPKLPNGEALGEIGPANENLIAGLLYLRQAKVDKAIEKLEASNELDRDHYTAYMLARAYAAAHDWKKAESSLQNIINAKGAVLADDTPLLWVLAHYDLARCYQGEGRTTEAATYYSKFLETWKEADKNLAQVSDARKQMARLM